jgi:hypothetical protein
MKRVVLPLVGLLILAGAGIYLLRHLARGPQVATWLPGTTILFADMPDIHRTKERWPRTELAQIINEPEVQAFLARPMGRIPHREALDRWMDDERRIDPEHFFLAVTDWNESAAPSVVAGVSFGGSRQEMDGLVDKLRRKAQETWPEGKSDIEKYGTGEIETFTTASFSAGLAYRGRWLFMATDTAALKAALDRYDGQKDPNSLAELPAFTRSLREMPGSADGFFFARPGQLADKADSLALMVNPTADVHAADSLKEIESVSLGLKLDGAVMRDVTYVAKPEPGGETPLAKDALKLSSTDTMVAVSNRAQIIGDAQMPDPKADPTGVLQLMASYVKIFAGKGLGEQQLEQAFGPESGFVVDWPPGAIIPMPLAMLDVRDAALARKFLDTLATLPIAAGVDFTHEDADGISFYSLPPIGAGLFPLQVTVGLTGKCLIGALSVDAVKEAARRWDNPGTGLDAVEGYKKAAGLVEEPTKSFTYVDTKGIFEKIYGLLGWVGLMPHVSEYVDIGKLPAAETISRHLSPIVASGSVKDGGLLVESAGPVTTTQAAVATVITAAAVAVPLVKEEIKGQDVPIPGLFGLGGKGSNGVQNPFTTPWNQGSSAGPTAPMPQPTPGAGGASASPSGGTP